MCSDQISDVSFCQILAEFLERKQQVFFCNGAAAVGVKYAEYWP